VAFASNLNRWGRVYGWTVVSVGFAVVGESVLHFYRSPIGPQWILLAALTLISGSASVYLPWAHVSISISEAFVFTAVLLYGPEAGTLTVALDGLVLSLWVAKRRPGIERALFNFSAPAASAWCSAQLFFWISGISPLVEKPASLDQILPALVVFAVAYFAINSWLIAFIIALEKRLKPWDVWRTGFVWLSLNYFCGASVAVLLVGYNREIDIRFVGLVIPLLLVLYFTFKTSTDRVADANHHVEELNHLYLSTIETLAMAIDAKDQITHGHIRRVQAYAVGLARVLGVADVRLIKAIEAAALLHDMGKIAIPEHILNKPGKLTPSEFDRMKLHASVGADILSAIDFPYPVVPIVRYHHENWDGTGYPTGLRGTSIPIGARILSVVDCFDALTSDRPYRPRLSDDEALHILSQRRGTMYDPLVVDTFISVYKNITPPEMDLVQRSGAVAQLTAPTQSIIHHERITAPANQQAERFDQSEALSHCVNPPPDGLDLIAVTEAISGLLSILPSTSCILFVYDPVEIVLEEKYSVGTIAAQVTRMRIGLGQKLSGWVGANRQTIVNSDPMLDLAEIAVITASPLKSCLSTPLVTGDELVGVLSFYANDVNAFGEGDRIAIETVAQTIANELKRAGHSEQTVFTAR
jgi:putative nucleotidyltransferase with HDIG domain